ncbi:oxygenase [Lithospermum erythrorhizon]|uniref:Oxygenase n=1 Tax=Lithospermum erythrorhizon TaxID=34254 RepID=A0AAV3QYJ0_LITER
MELAGRPNVADYFPLLKWFDPQGLRRKTQFHVNKAFDIVGAFLKERIEKRQNEGGGMKKEKDYLDVLLEYGEVDSGCFQKFSSTAINVVVFEMFTAGTDTTTSTLEWAMAELLKNQKLLEKVQHEIRSVIAQGNKITEKDIDNLPYLKAVINETLRLHPPLPFLVPHMAMKSCNMFQYDIPKETQVLVNVWAIGRDPNAWKDPLEFKPERFVESNTRLDYKGQHFEYLPFGSGRRMCHAVPLVSRVLPLALGSVLHSFDWALPDGIRAEALDMRERMGITLRKQIALKAIPMALKA